MLGVLGRSNRARRWTVCRGLGGDAGGSRNGSCPERQHFAQYSSWQHLSLPQMGWRHGHASMRSNASRLSSLRVTTCRLHVPIIVAGTFAGSAAEEQGITNYVLGSSFPRRRCIILCRSAPALTRVPLQKGLQWSDKIWDVSRGISLLEEALASCRLCSDVHTLRLIL